MNCLMTPPEFEINTRFCGAASISWLDLQHDDTLHQQSSDKINFDTKHTSSEKSSHAVIRRSSSFSTLSDYPSSTTSENTLQCSKQYHSLSNLSISTVDSDEEDYVVQSLYSSTTSVNDYLELLPAYEPATYELVTYEPVTYDDYKDGHIYDEINQHTHNYMQQK